MTHFIRLLTESNKATELLVACSHYRMNEPDHRYFDVLPEAFENVPGRPFAYWVSENVRSLFRSTPAFEGEGRVAQHGGSTKDDFRFLRVWWEQPNDKHKWTPFAKGGKFARFYSDVDLVVNWESDARELEAALLVKYPYLGENASWVLHRECRYGQAGITWPRRPSTGGCFWILPKGCIFSDNGPAAFLDSSNPTDIFAALAITNSKAFNALVQLLFSRGGAGSGQTMTYEVGYVGRTPFPHIENAIVAQLADEASRAWQLGRTLDSINETSHAFSLPFALRSRLGRFERPEIESGLADIQAKIDEVAFSLYRFNLADQQAADDAVMSVVSVTNVEDCDENGESAVADLLSFDSLLSWAVGVAFGRFDWRFATGDRPAPPDPDPFDPLPARSPGMLVAGAEPFFVHAGILNDDQGHLHDLATVSGCFIGMPTTMASTGPHRAPGRLVCENSA